MFVNPIRQISGSSDAVLRQQYDSLRAQIPLMYALMFLNSSFLAIVTLHDVPIKLGLGIPSVLSLIIVIRASIWLLRRSQQLDTDQLRRYLYGTLLVSIILSAAFGSWGLLLYSVADPVRSTSVALFVFVGSISCCYCLQALPVAGRFVLLFGAMPMTVRLLTSADWYLFGIGMTFLMVAAMILRTLSTGHAALVEVLRSRSEMSTVLAAQRRSEERYRLAAQATSDVIWDWSLDADTIEWSGAVEKVFGNTAALHGTPNPWWLKRIHPADRAEVFQSLSQIISASIGQWRQEFRFRMAGGRYSNLLARGHVVRDDAARPVRLIGSLQDLTAQRHDEAQLLWAANHDFLTRLPNRHLFAERLNLALEEAARDEGNVALIVLDLDRFKALNDTLGHHVGDVMLREFGARLEHNMPSSATVARLGGDEFAIIIPFASPHEASIEAVLALLHGLDSPLPLGERQIEVSFCAGSALAFQDGETPEELHKAADLALYAAKTDGSGRTRCFQPMMRDAVEREKQMLNAARSALDDDRIMPFYQPKVCLRTGSPAGFEALLRWHDHSGGLQPPAGIAAAFDDADLSVLLTDRMLDRVISDMVGWCEKDCDFGRVAINGSLGDFRRNDFADRILGRMQRAGLPPSLLELEVTETVLVGQLQKSVSNALLTLSEAGVTIALDDFGTGYASLTHLKQFPVDTIKIDQSFVSRLGSTDTEDSAIVGAVIDLARNLGITTVAEGIEQSLQAEQLKSRGCDIGQGFLFGRAIPSSRVAGMLSNWDEEVLLAQCSTADDRHDPHMTRPTEPAN